MKIRSKQIRRDSHVEHYELDGAWADVPANRGLVLCHALAFSDRAELMEVHLRAEQEEIGEPIAWERSFSGQRFRTSFSDLHRFLEIYDGEDFGVWTLHLVFQNTEVLVSGHRTQTLIGVTYPAQAELNLLPLLKDAEDRTYESCDWDSDLLGILKKKYRMSQKRAVLTLQELRAEPDLYAEFASTLRKDSFPPMDRAICVEGFTAAKLNQSYPLSTVGAYNFLRYLRQSPNEALADLEKNLPRR